MGDAQMKDYVLAWVNKQRLERGHKALDKLRKGERRRSTCCVIAASLSELGGLVASSGYCTTVLPEKGTERFTMTHPRIVTEFVGEFDAGLFPELDLAVR